MKAASRIFTVLGCCAVVAAIVFPILAREPAGSMMLGVFALAMLYLGRELYRGATTDRAEDGQAQAEVGPEHVFPSSWWPVVMALGIALVAAGLVFTPVLTVEGAVIFVVAVVGWLYQQTESGHGARAEAAQSADGQRAKAGPAQEAASRVPAQPVHDRGHDSA
ncbi:MAG: cytochrome c oxidase subunit 4 [Actinobacteria bacterium]|nr:cytochrome c oxidase subunit 4 [Actinomycetota bacterium]